jgi:4-amino-4-deoxy-L-arabinose transferase-like glycosyltransferase
MRPFRVVLASLVALPAFWHIALLGWLFAVRLSYPMDIEWMEGGVLYHAYRFMHGLDIYGRVSQGFLPYPYPPGYFALLGIAGGIFGLDYGTGRALSVLFFAIACAVMAREVRRHYAGRPHATAMAIVSVGWIAATFPVVGGWYDLIRNDSMVMALVVLGAALVSDERPSTRRVLGAACALTAAVFAKQTAAFFIPWIVLFLVVRSPRRGVLLAVVTGGAALAILGLLGAPTGGSGPGS